MRLGPGLLYEGRTLQGARPKLADFCSATMAEFYSAVDIPSVDPTNHRAFAVQQPCNRRRFLLTSVHWFLFSKPAARASL